MMAAVRHPSPRRWGRAAAARNKQEQLDEQRCPEERDIQHRQPVKCGNAKHPYYRQDQRQYECQYESHRAISIVVPRYLSRMGNSLACTRGQIPSFYLLVMSAANHFPEILVRVPSLRMAVRASSTFFSTACFSGVFRKGRAFSMVSNGAPACCSGSWIPDQLGGGDAVHHEASMRPRGDILLGRSQQILRISISSCWGRSCAATLRKLEPRLTATFLPSGL